MLDFVTNYRDHIRESNHILKDHYGSDQLAKQCRNIARQRIADAINPDGLLNWSKLPKLVTSNPKLDKTPDGLEVLTAGFAGSPSWSSGYNMCSNASDGCGQVCLFGSGHGQRHMMHDGLHTVWIARIIRTMLFMEYRDQFKTRLVKEIASHKRKADRLGVICAFRGNIMTDIRWEKIFPEMFSMFPDVVFYDYAKDPNRDVSHIPNYSLTFSRSERNDMFCEMMLNKGMNVTVVVRIKKGQPLPRTFRGMPMIDGDLHDFRPSDPKGVYVGLRPKGNDAWNDASGFVVDVQ